MTPGPAQGNPPVIEGLRWVRLLGAGGLAEVHLYHQDLPDRDVAVKVLRSGKDAGGRAELTREADALSLVSGHPAVVTLYFAGTAVDGRPFLAMENCPVADVSDQVRARPLAVPRALDWMIRIAAGVETLHRAGMVHGDIKPSNIMLTRYDAPVLADFGLATRIGERYPRGRYSALWASPEQQVGEGGASPVQDVWSLAATMWTLLAGRSPFEAVDGDNGALAVAARVQAGAVPPLPRADIPAELDAALRAALRTDPARRTPSAWAFGEALRQVQAAMRAPVTAFDVPGAREGTSAPVIDANRTVVRGVAHVGPTPAGPVDDGAAARVTPDDDVVAPRPKKSRVALWLAIGIVGCAAAVTAWLFGINGTVRPEQGPGDVQPEDPVGAPPSAVQNLRGNLADDVITWSWESSPQSKERYFYTVTMPNGVAQSDQTSRSIVSVAAVSGRTCIEVVAVSDDGRQSPASSNCVDAP